MISFPGGWSGIVNKQYESNLTPTDVVGRILRFQLQTGVPIISRKDKTSDSTCKKPPILGLDIIEPGKIYSLKYLSDQIRVFVSGFNNWIENRHNYADYVDLQRNDIPFFWLNVFGKKTSPRNGK